MNHIYLKEENSPYIFALPHSGEKITSDMPWQLTPEAQKFLPNVDWHLNELYGFLKNYNVNIISTSHSRYVVDVNRPPNAEKFGDYRHSLVYSSNTWDEEIYAIPPNDEEIERRIHRYYEPFHQELEILITKKLRKFGKVYLIDLHSFMGPITEDVCLGNRHNVTCSEAFLEKVYNAFDAEGFETVKNKIFIGGYITKSYAVKEVVEALQIELRYTNYIEPQDLDVRQVPRKETNLFEETAFRLERVFEKVGIEKLEKHKAIVTTQKENIWTNKFLWVLALAVVLFLSLIEK